MANVSRQRHADKWGVVALPVDSAQVIEKGDIVYLNADDVRPASSYTYVSGNLAQTQANFAKQFVGVALEKSDNGDTDSIPVARKGIFEFDCAAATFEIGDIVGVDDNGGATALVDQQVIAMGEGGVSGIGVVVKRYGSNTTRVLVEIMPYANQILPPQVITMFSGLITSAADIVTDWVVPFPFKLLQLRSITTVATNAATVISVHKDAQALDDTMTIASGAAIGEYDSATMDDATGDDIFEADDTLSLLSDGACSAGEALFQIVVAPYRIET